MLRSILHTIHNTHTILQTIHTIAYMSSPAHVEIIAEEKNEEIVKESEETVVKLSKKQLAQAKSKKVTIGGDA